MTLVKIEPFLQKEQNDLASIVPKRVELGVDIQHLLRQRQSFHVQDMRLMLNLWKQIQ